MSIPEGLDEEKLAESALAILSLSRKPVKLDTHKLKIKYH